MGGLEMGKKSQRPAKKKPFIYFPGRIFYYWRCLKGKSIRIQSASFRNERTKRYEKKGHMERKWQMKDRLFCWMMNNHFWQTHLTTISDDAWWDLRGLQIDLAKTVYENVMIIILFLSLLVHNGEKHNFVLYILRKNSEDQTDLWLNVKHTIFVSGRVPDSHS